MAGLYEALIVENPLDGRAIVVCEDCAEGLEIWGGPPVSPDLPQPFNYTTEGEYQEAIAAALRCRLCKQPLVERDSIATLEAQEWTWCRYPDCRVQVVVPPAPREPLCDEHVTTLARWLLRSTGEDRVAAIAEYRRRVMGLE